MTHTCVSKHIIASDNDTNSYIFWRPFCLGLNVLKQHRWIFATISIHFIYRHNIIYMRCPNVDHHSAYTEPFRSISVAVLTTQWGAFDISDSDYVSLIRFKMGREISWVLVALNVSRIWDVIQALKHHKCDACVSICIPIMNHLINHDSI